MKTNCFLPMRNIRFKYLERIERMQEEYWFLIEGVSYDLLCSNNNKNIVAQDIFASLIDRRLYKTWEKISFSNRKFQRHTIVFSLIMAIDAYINNWHFASYKYKSISSLDDVMNKNWDKLNNRECDQLEMERKKVVLIQGIRSDIPVSFVQASLQMSKTNFNSIIDNGCRW